VISKVGQAGWGSTMVDFDGAASADLPLVQKQARKNSTKIRGGPSYA
jgi:hypothetical protein